MWEEPEWEMWFDKACSPVGGGKACKHCKALEDIKTNGWTETNRWSCPRVIVVWNEGGYSSTGVCADCVLEALKDEAEKRVVKTSTKEK
jgi:hypothetical protein